MRTACCSVATPVMQVALPLRRAHGRGGGRLRGGGGQHACTRRHGAQEGMRDLCHGREPLCVQAARKEQPPKGQHQLSEPRRPWSAWIATRLGPCSPTLLLDLALRVGAPGLDRCMGHRLVVVNSAHEAHLSAGCGPCHIMGACGRSHVACSQTCASSKSTSCGPCACGRLQGRGGARGGGGTPCLDVDLRSPLKGRGRLTLVHPGQLTCKRRVPCCSAHRAGCRGATLAARRCRGRLRPAGAHDHLWRQRHGRSGATGSSQRRARRRRQQQRRRQRRRCAAGRGLFAARCHGCPAAPVSRPAPTPTFCRWGCVPLGPALLNSSMASMAQAGRGGGISACHAIPSGVPLQRMSGKHATADSGPPQGRPAISTRSHGPGSAHLQCTHAVVVYNAGTARYLCPPDCIQHTGLPVICQHLCVKGSGLLHVYVVDKSACNHYSRGSTLGHQSCAHHHTCVPPGDY